jgi:pimeloyl-ACP methyl ester carboxylesterase
MAGQKMVRRHVMRGAAQIEALIGGEGPTLLLLPSLGRGAEDFFRVAALLMAEDYRVVCPEPRGIGGSRGPMGGLTLYDLAEDAAAAAGPGPLVVAGHAFGNWVARALAVVRPEQVKGVALLAASLDTTVDPAVRATINGSFDAALTGAQRLAHLQRGYFAPGHDARIWLTGWHPAVTVMQRSATALTDAAWKRVADRVPTLYVAAEQDFIAPVPTLERLHAVLGEQISLVTVPEAGHALLPEQPAVTAAALVAFAKALGELTP